MSGRKFFNLHSPPDQYAFVRAPEEFCRLIIPDQGWVHNWASLSLYISKGSGIISDYMTSVLEGRLCSEKLKAIIDENKGENDIIQWLPIDIFVEETEETLRYHHLHFPEPPDCLSKPHCKYGPGPTDLIVPFYSYAKIKDREIFNSSGGYEIIVTLLSDRMRKILEESECTGLNIDRANVIYDEKSNVIT